MGDIGTQAQNAEQTEGQQDNFTQEQVNAIVRDRLAKERAKYADYNDLKTKAAEYDKQQEASKTELQKAQEKSEALEKELADMKTKEKVRGIREQVSEKTGVPTNLLTGSTEEDCQKQAEDILAFAKGSKYPGIKETSHKNNNSHVSSGEPSENDFRELASQVFGRKD